MRHRKSLIASSVILGSATAAGIILFSVKSNIAQVSAAPTALGKIQVETHSQAMDVAASFKWTSQSPKTNPVVTVDKIISNLAAANNLEVQKATSITAVQTVLSGLPEVMINPQYVIDDPQIQRDGDYLNNVPVWIITFNGVTPPVHGPKGITVKNIPNSHSEIYDSNTGDLLLGFS